LPFMEFNFSLAIHKPHSLFIRPKLFVTAVLYVAEVINYKK